jgi:hypothetical protein
MMSEELLKREIDMPQILKELRPLLQRIHRESSFVLLLV